MALGKWTQLIKDRWNEPKEVKSPFIKDVAEYHGIPDDVLFKSFHIEFDARGPAAVFDLSKPERIAVPVTTVPSLLGGDILGVSPMHSPLQVVEFNNRAFSLRELQERHEALTEAGLDSGLTEQAMRELGVEVEKAERLSQRQGKHRESDSPTSYKGRG